MKIAYTGRIAIIGMAGRMPGSENLDQFWQAQLDGKSLLTPLTEAQLQEAGVTEAIRTLPNYVPVASSMADIDSFDHEFFGYGLREASVIDPQQRVLLELAQEAFEHAGYVADALNDKVGVYLGTGYCNYLVNNLSGEIDANDQLSGLQILMGNDKEYAATRVSYKLNLRGPSVAVNSACSTSLVAIHQACRALQSYECDYALAGAAKISIPNLTGYVAQEGGISSRDGTCRPYDAQGTGPVFGSGAGVVLLKRIEDAIADGDQIYAVIRGSAINNDGAAKVSFSAPSTDGQIEVIADALADADVSASAIGYVEGHGTSTPLGDPIEVAALSEIYHSEGVPNASCYLGSVKANVGHLEAAAGMAGLFKVVYALRQQRIPPLLNFTSPNKNIKLEQTPFIINREPVSWAAAGGQERLAALSSFGIGGTNAHLIVQEYSADPADNAAHFPLPEVPIAAVSGPFLLPISAASEQAAGRLRAAYKGFVESEQLALAQVALQSALGRKHQFNVRTYRQVIVANDQQDLLRQLAGAPVTTEVAVSLSLQTGNWDVSTWEKDRSLLGLSLRSYLAEIDETLVNLLAKAGATANKQALQADLRLMAAYASWIKASGISFRQILCDRRHLPLAAFLADALPLADALRALLMGQGVLRTDSEPGKTIALANGHIQLIGEVQTLVALTTPSCWLQDADAKQASSPKADVQFGLPGVSENPQRIHSALTRLLAGHYVAGTALKWANVYRNIKYQKMALPSYPFAKVRCWIAPRTQQQPIALDKKVSALSEAAVIEHIASFSHTNSANIHPDTQFQRDLMMESMMLAEFNSSLTSRFNLQQTIPLAFYFQGGSVGELIVMLSQLTRADTSTAQPATNELEAKFIAHLNHWQASSQFPALQRLERKLVHKSHDKNVLVARTDLVEVNVFAAEITQDTAHEYYYEHAQDHVPGLYMIEAARQAATAIVHEYYQVPYGYKFILNDLNSSFSGFAELTAPLFMGLVFSDLIFKNGIVDRARASVSFFQSGKLIGSMQSQAVIFAPDNYNHVRDGHAVIAG